MKNTQNNLNEKINDIIERIDNASASSLLKQLVNLSLEEKKFLGTKLDEFLIKLRIVNFISISDAEAVELVKNHLLLFFKIDVPFEQRLIARYAFYGTTEKNEQREIIKSAILENTEKLGNFTIGEWLKKFDKYSEINDAENQNIIDFISSSNEASRLNETEKYILKSIIHTYDSLIADELMDIFDAVAMLKSLEKKYGDKDVPIELVSASDYQLKKTPEGMAMSEIPSRRQQSSAMYSNNTIQSEKMPLSDALKQYPETGEQLITSQKIELKSFPEPVRPSVKNWLADYVHLLGYEDHDAIERANYLFHTTNTRNLSEPDRERLAYILKAFDEKTPIDVDPVRKQIVFPVAQKSPEPLRSAKTEHFPLERGRALQSPPVPNLTPAVPLEKGGVIKKTFQSDPPDIYEMYRIKKAEPKQTISAGKIFSTPPSSNIQEAKFDFPQKMPYEKAQEKKPAPVNPSLQPYRITSSNIRRNEDQKPPVNPNNIIDLKNLQ